MIELNKITKRYITEEVETIALNDISMKINQGEFVSIMGPSGCGKSTLLNIIGLMDSISEGSYCFLDKEVSKLNEEDRTILRRGNIGFIFQSFNLIDDLSVYRNIELPLKIIGVPSHIRKKRVEEIITKMNLSHRANHFPRQLSGGQQQRVAIARACVYNPKLILADEPTGNLDSDHGLDVLSLLKELNNNGTTIIMVTHNLRDAQIANRRIELFDGCIVSDKTI